MIAPRESGARALNEVDDEGFDAFLGLAFGVRAIGDSRLGFALELPWLQYDNEKVRHGLRTAVSELSIAVPYRKEGETRGRGGDSLSIFLEATTVFTAIGSWVYFGSLVLKAIEYLKREAPSVLISDGPAMTIAANAIFDHLADNDLSYSFTLPSALCQGLGIDIAERAYLCGFSSGTHVAWSAVGDEGEVLFVQSAPIADRPPWWVDAFERDKARPPTLQPRADEF
jgi:hypothetical protein